jgi:hypothetical protein
MGRYLRVARMGSSRRRTLVKWSALVAVFLSLGLWLGSGFFCVGRYWDQTTNGGSFSWAEVIGGRVVFKIMTSPPSPQEWVLLSPDKPSYRCISLPTYHLSWRPECFQQISQLTVVIPLWIPTVLFFALTGWSWLADARIRRRVAVGRCEQCGYDQIGLESKVCPECGAPR